MKINQNTGMSRFLEDNQPDDHQAHSSKPLPKLNLTQIIHDNIKSYKEFQKILFSVLGVAVAFCIINFIGFKRVGKWVLNFISLRWILWLIIFVRFRTRDTNPAAAVYDGVMGARKAAKDAINQDEGLEDEDEEDSEDPFKKKTMKIEELEMEAKLKQQKLKGEEMDNRNKDDFKIQFQQSNESHERAKEIIEKKDQSHIFTPWIIDFKKAFSKIEELKPQEVTELKLAKAFKDSAINHQDFLLYKMKQ